MNVLTAPLAGAAPGAAGLAPAATPQGGEGEAAAADATRAGGFAALLNAVLRPFLAPAPVEPAAETAAGEEASGPEGEPGATGEGAAEPAGTLAAERAGQAVRGAALRDGSGGWIPREGPARAPAPAPRAESEPAEIATGPAPVAPGVPPRPERPAPEAGAPTVRAGEPDPRHVHLDPALLHPELRVRVERVVERMRREHGHEVRVTETFREQSRQDFLYAQGRTRPGPVVTWTRASNHTAGRAVDVVVDGSYDTPLGYARLARIAREEGLHTLGARDPGHLELPGAGRGRSFAPTFDPAALDGADAPPLPSPRAVAAHTTAAPPPAGVARVAEVAHVATVTRVAEVAQVARVATVGGGAPVRRREAADGGEGARIRTAPEGGDASSPRPSAAPEGGDPRPLPARPVAEAPADPRRREGERGEAAGTEPVPAAAPEAGARAEHDRAALSPHPAAREPSGSAAERVAAPAGVDAASRVAEVVEARDAGPARPLARMTLRVENAEGGEDRIRVDLRGSTVDAAIDTGTAATAERLNARLGELQQALERQGLEAESLRVRAALEAEAPRVAATSRTQDPAPERERPDGAPHEPPRRDPGSSHQRSRREQKEEEAP